MSNEQRRRAILVYCKVARYRLDKAVANAECGSWPNCETDVGQVIAVLEMARDRFAEIFAESVFGDER